MGWHGHLNLHYTRDGDRTIAHDRHRGPLRVLQRLYPEGGHICHHVLVHPPGGLVGGDVLALDARLDAHCHALLTTPGATRFYRSAGEPATQQIDMRVGDAARLEWLPLETIAYDGCRAVNQQRFSLAPTAEMIGWDLLALGLPTTGAPWQQGQFRQDLAIPGVWLERALIDAQDRVLLDSAAGWNRQRVLGTAWFCAGQPLVTARAQALVEAARHGLADVPAGVVGGATWLQPPLVVVRVLGPRVEPVFAALTRVWSAWRSAAWDIPVSVPRIWRT